MNDVAARDTTFDNVKPESVWIIHRTTKDAKYIVCFVCVNGIEKEIAKFYVGEYDGLICESTNLTWTLKSALESANAEIAILKAKIELQRENSIASSAHHEANFGHLKTHYEFKNKKLADENAEISAENVRLRAALEKIKWLGNESRKHSLPDLKTYRCPTCDSAEIAHEALEKLK